MTNSIKIAQQDLNSEIFFIIYPGIKSYTLDQKMFVISLKDARAKELFLDKREISWTSLVKY